jgi:hypothetical protein
MEPQQFFDFDNPCPPEIINCAKLREDYKSELDKLRRSEGCTSCMERSLRNKYIMYIMSLTKQQ